MSVAEYFPKSHRTIRASFALFKKGRALDSPPLKLKLQINLSSAGSRVAGTKNHLIIRRRLRRLLPELR